MVFLSLILALAPDGLDTERAANIEREQAKEVAAVSERYGHKKSTELSREERAAMVRELAAAEKKVLEKFGVSQREWARQQIGRSRLEAAQVKEAVRRLEAQERAAAEQEAAERAAAALKEVSIQRGISDENPVTLEQREGEQPVVEQGLPAEFQNDQQAAAESDALEKTATPEAAPARPAGKGTKR